jgi:hypothetical protein
MKTQSKFTIAGFAATMLIVSSSFAQPSTVKNLQPALNTGNSIKVYENVQEAFEKIFENAENVRWDKVERNYLAKFSINDVEKRALLSPKGQLIYEITYGKEKQLPVNLRKDIKRAYVEFKITSATLVEEANRSIWVINLEDDTHLVTARVENNEIEEVRKYVKM